MPLGDDPLQATTEQVLQDILARDRADVKALNSKIGRMSYAGVTWAQDPKNFGKEVSDSEIMAAAEAAQRLHKYGDLYGGPWC